RRSARCDRRRGRVGTRDGTRPVGRPHVGGVARGIVGPARLDHRLPQGRLMARWFYEDVADALVSFLPPVYRDFGSQISGRNIKIWFGEDHREHYEVQQLGRSKLEIGFHAEYSAEARNEAVI